MYTKFKGSALPNTNSNMNNVNNNIKSRKESNTSPNLSKPMDMAVVQICYNDNVVKTPKSHQHNPHPNPHPQPTRHWSKVKIKHSQQNIKTDNMITQDLGTISENEPVGRSTIVSDANMSTHSIKNDCQQSLLLRNKSPINIEHQHQCVNALLMHKPANKILCLDQATIHKAAQEAFELRNAQITTNQSNIQHQQQQLVKVSDEAQGVVSDRVKKHPQSSHDIIFDLNKNHGRIKMKGLMPLITNDQTSSIGELSASSRTQNTTIRYQLEKFNLIDPCKLNGTIQEEINASQTYERVKKTKDIANLGLTTGQQTRKHSNFDLSTVASLYQHHQLPGNIHITNATHNNVGAGNSQFKEAALQKGTKRSKPQSAQPCKRKPPINQNDQSNKNVSEPKVIQNFKQLVLTKNLKLKKTRNKKVHAKTEVVSKQPSVENQVKSARPSAQALAATTVCNNEFKQPKWVKPKQTAPPPNVYIRNIKLRQNMREDNNSNPVAPMSASAASVAKPALAQPTSGVTSTIGIQTIENNTQRARSLSPQEQVETLNIQEFHTDQQQEPTNETIQSDGEDGCALEKTLEGLTFLRQYYQDRLEAAMYNQTPVRHRIVQKNHTLAAYSRKQRSFVSGFKDGALEMTSPEKQTSYKGLFNPTELEMKMVKTVNETKEAWKQTLEQQQTISSQQNLKKNLISRYRHSTAATDVNDTIQNQLDKQQISFDVSKQPQNQTPTRNLIKSCSFQNGPGGISLLTKLQSSKDFGETIQQHQSSVKEHQARTTYQIQGRQMPQKLKLNNNCQTATSLTSHFVNSGRAAQTQIAQCLSQVQQLSANSTLTPTAGKAKNFANNMMDFRAKVYNFKDKVCLHEQDQVLVAGIKNLHENIALNCADGDPLLKISADRKFSILNDPSTQTRIMSGRKQFSSSSFNADASQADALINAPLI